MIKVSGMNADISSSDESSGDSDHLYYEFDSSDNENVDTQSMATKSTDRKAPMIQDITPNK